MPGSRKTFANCRSKFTPSADIDFPAFPPLLPYFPAALSTKVVLKFFLFCRRQDVYFRLWRKNNNRLAVWIHQAEGRNFSLFRCSTFSLPRCVLPLFCVFYFPKTAGLSGFLSGIVKVATGYGLCPGDTITCTVCPLLMPFDTRQEWTLPLTWTTRANGRGLWWAGVELVFYSVSPHFWCFLAHAIVATTRRLASKNIHLLGNCLLFFWCTIFCLVFFINRNLIKRHPQIWDCNSIFWTINFQKIM